MWSTDHVDLDDPFQRHWWLRQVLMYGLAEDVRKLDFSEIERELDELHLPLDINSLWRTYFEWKRKEK